MIYIAPIKVWMNRIRAWSLLKKQQCLVHICDEWCYVCSKLMRLFALYEHNFERWFRLLPRDAMLSALYATPIPPVRPYVCQSHAWFVSKRLNSEHIIEILSRFDRPIILVFRHQGSLRKSDGFTPTGTPNTRGSDFRPIPGYISETVRDAYLLWKTNIKLYVLYRIVSLSMSLSDLEPQFQGHSII